MTRLILPDLQSRDNKTANTVCLRTANTAWLWISLLLCFINFVNACQGQTGNDSDCEDHNEPAECGRSEEEEQKKEEESNRACRPRGFWKSSRGLRKF